MSVAKIGTSFATKLNILIIGLQLLTVIGVVAACGYSLFEDYPPLIERTQRQITSAAVSRIRSEFQRVIDRAGAASTIYSANYKFDDEKARNLQELLGRDSHIASASYFEKASAADGAKMRWHYATESYPAADLKSLQLVSALQIDAMGRNDIDANLVKLEDGRKIVRLAVGLHSTAATTAFWVIDLKASWVENLLNESSAATIYLTDARQKILVSNDPAHMPDDAHLDHSFENALAAQGAPPTVDSPSVRQLDYVDFNGNKQMAFIGNVGLAGMRLIMLAPAKQIAVTMFQLIKKSAGIAAIFFLFSFILSRLFSARIKDSIVNLWVAAMKVAKGDYSTRLPVAKRTGWLDSDELQAFAGTFNEMVSGLEERSRVVALLSKLHGKELAEHLKSKRLNLGGERKHCIVFFSDIRGFTTLSENTPPELVVQLLNRYLTVMIKVIEASRGVVTGIQGDGIMAVWGLHETAEFAADEAINACFEMRKALNTLNSELVTEGKAPIFMGMGLHYGPIIAGTIGSHNRMEFTAIGDTANTASRIESATKEFGTDLLISNRLLEQSKGNYLLEKVEVRVKGKQKPVSLYKVFGTKDPFGERHIRTPYSDYKPEKMQSLNYDDQSVQAGPGDQPMAPAPSAAGDAPKNVTPLPQKPAVTPPPPATAATAAAAGKKKSVRLRGWSG